MSGLQDMAASHIRPIRRRALRLAAENLLPADVLVRRGPTDRRRVALTFDDGPDDLTCDYLDVLERRDVHATFFVVGEQCRDHGDALVDVVRRGHEVGQHGFRHQRLPQLRRREIEDELRRSAELLPQPRTRRPLLRPPNGDTSVRSLLVCSMLGYRTVLWSCDSGDFRIEDADEVARRVAPSVVRQGDIVLLHEGQRWTLRALPRIVDELLAAGMELVTVGELLEGAPA